MLLFEILMIIIYFHSLGNISDSHGLQMIGSRKKSKASRFIWLKYVESKDNFAFVYVTMTCNIIHKWWNLTKYYMIGNRREVPHPPFQLLIIVDEKPTVPQDQRKGHDHLQVFS